MGSGSSAPTMTDLREKRNNELLTAASLRAASSNGSAGFSRAITDPGSQMTRQFTAGFENASGRQGSEELPKSPKSTRSTKGKTRQISEDWGGQPGSPTRSTSAAKSSRQNFESTQSGNRGAAVRFSSCASRQSSTPVTTTTSSRPACQEAPRTTRECQTTSGNRFPMLNRLIGAACPRQRKGSQVEGFTGVGPQLPPPSSHATLNDYIGLQLPACHSTATSVDGSGDLPQYLPQYSSVGKLMESMPSQGSTPVGGDSTKPDFREGNSQLSYVSDPATMSTLSTLTSSRVSTLSAMPDWASLGQPSSDPSPQAQQVIGALTFRCTQLELELHRLRAEAAERHASDAAKGSQCSSPSKHQEFACSSQSSTQLSSPSSSFTPQLYVTSDQLHLP